MRQRNFNNFQILPKLTIYLILSQQRSLMLSMCFIKANKEFNLSLSIYSDDPHDDDIIFEDFARLRLKGGETEA